MRTTLAARMQFGAAQLQIEGTVRGSAQGLRPQDRGELSAAIEPLLRVREGMRTEPKAFDRTLASAARRSDVGSAFDDDPRRRAGDHSA
jgi:hypothetical protein